MIYDTTGVAVFCSYPHKHLLILLNVALGAQPIILYLSNGLDIHSNQQRFPVAPNLQLIVLLLSQMSSFPHLLPTGTLPEMSRQTSYPKKMLIFSISLLILDKEVCLFLWGFKNAVWATTMKQQTEHVCTTYSMDLLTLLSISL